MRPGRPTSASTVSTAWSLVTVTVPQQERTASASRWQSRGYSPDLGIRRHGPWPCCAAWQTLLFGSLHRYSQPPAPWTLARFPCSWGVAMGQSSGQGGVNGSLLGASGKAFALSGKRETWPSLLPFSLLFLLF